MNLQQLVKQAEENAQRYAEESFRQLMLDKYGIAEPMAPDDGEDE
jgi:hypothetical protein